MIRTGAQYIKGLETQREVYVAGERVTDVTTYAPFRRTIESYARAYDLKHDPRYQDVTTWVGDDGDRFDISFLVPKTHDQLRAKGRGYHAFSEISYGCLGRGPESMSALVAGLSESCEWFDQYVDGGAERVSDWCDHVRREDLFVTHALGNPQTDRSKQSHQQADEFLHLRIKEETPEGLIIRGAKQLATAAPYADEVIVFPNGRQFGPGDEAYALCFALPMTAPGLKTVCREPFTTTDDQSVYDHPLSSRFEEVDAMLVFDDVLVPWDRVFFYGNLEAANNMRFMTAVASFSGHLSIRRAVLRSGLVVATAIAQCDAVKTSAFVNVGELLGKIAATHKALEALLFRAEEDPRVADNGTYYVNADALTTAGLLYPDFYDAMLAVIKRTGAAGLMLTPTAADLNGEAGPIVDTFFAGAEGMSGGDRVQIGKLAWDLAGSAVGQRLAHYERFYIGEPMFVANFFSKSVDLAAPRELLATLLEEGRKDRVGRA